MADDPVATESGKVEGELRTPGEALVKTHERPALLAHITGQLLAREDPQRLVEGLCRRVMEHLGCDVFLNFLVDEERKCLHLNACAGITAEVARGLEWIGFGIDPCSTACRDGCRKTARYIGAIPDEDSGLVGASGIRAYTCHPLLSEKGKVLGTLSFGTRSRAAFTEDELAFLKTVADHVAMAIWRGKARDELERRVREMTGLLDDAYGRLEAASEERKRMEQQLRQAQQMEALGTLTDGLAHDFNNILGAIVGFTELAKKDALAGSRQEHYLQRVADAGARGRHLIKQMLTFSRKTDHKKRLWQLSAIVQDGMVFLRASIPSTIDVRVTVDSEPGLVLADVTQMYQVLMNLCANAADAMREKGGVLDVRLGIRDVSGAGSPDGAKPGVYATLTVRDTGEGMSPDVAQRVFDPSFTTKKSGGGTGLGLSMVRDIVAHHEGHITVESRPGEGSTFTVYLPQFAVRSAAEVVVSEGPIPTGHERILFVDDEPALTEMGGELLGDLGYEVTVRNESVEALALFKAHPDQFDLIVTDQTMPNLTGIELARECVALRPNVPVILCTGFSYPVDDAFLRAAGVRIFLLKPLTRAELAQTVRRVLDE